MKTLILATLSFASIVFADPSAESAELPVPSAELAILDPTIVTQPFLTETSQLSLTPPELPLERAKKSAFVTVGLSALFPGLGHFYLQDAATGSTLAGTSLLSYAVATSPYLQESTHVTGFVCLQTAWSYGLYAAYRDVRKYNGESNYSYKMPTDSLADLTYAPFQWSILKKPEVWGGFLGSFALAAAVTYFGYSHTAYIQPTLSTPVSRFSPIVALPIGIGEETLFRGFLQSQLSELLNPWAGIALSSLAFGAAHIANASSLEPEERWRYYSFSVPLISTLGAYFGWLTYKNRSLKESVALHTWYDFVLFAAAAAASRAAAVTPPAFAMSLPF